MTMDPTVLDMAGFSVTPDESTALHGLCDEMFGGTGMSSEYLYVKIGQVVVSETSSSQRESFTLCEQYFPNKSKANEIQSQFSR